MLSFKKTVLIALAMILVLSLAGCGSARAAVDLPVKESIDQFDSRGKIGIADNDRNSQKEDYEWNKSRTYVVGEVTYHSFPEGWDNKGCCVEGFPEQGIKSAKIRLDAYKYYNYARLWNVAEADEEASYCYFKIGLFNWNGGKIRDEMNKTKVQQDSFNGLITDDYLELLSNNNQSIEYIFDIDWNHQHQAEEGDIVLLSVDPQLTYNPNYFIEEMKDRISFPKTYSAVVSPFSVDSPEPYIARFVDGKLQLPAELKDAFELRRLYDDTNPELTEIKDGDTVETVVNFLKAVEQDMVRYEEEMRQQPIQADRS